MKCARLVVVTVVLALSAAAQAADAEFRIDIRNHRFQPAELVVPAGQKVKLLVNNLDATPEEFESRELNREKVIPGGKSATIYVGPLDPGSYPFFGEFNPDSAQGRLIVK